MGVNPRLTRRLALGGLATAVAASACTSREAPVAGIVALPERSLAYAPLLLAAQAGLFQSPPQHVATLLRTGGQAVAAAIATGDAAAGALTLPDFVDAVEGGAPLVAIGALTRRFMGQLVATTARPPARTLETLLAGGWRGVAFGLQTGSDGTERLLRAFLLSSEPPPAVAASAARPLLAGDPLAGEPRFVGYRTDEALVAAWRDGRIEAFLGHSMATAPATLLGGAEVVANFSLGAIAPEAASAHCVVLAAHRDRVSAQPSPAGPPLLAALVHACGRAALDLSGPEQSKMAQRALPDRDALHLSAAIRLDAPSPEQSGYATDGRVPPAALPWLRDLRARAGSPAKAFPGELVVQL
jgi:ABC-type nitrate/sulfonate/bicarbonate transport system substrate-binding protein